MKIDIDFFSDTNTDPSRGMREAMANAKVGNEVAGEDPTVNELVSEVCNLLGKEAGIFLPSGTMCNVIAYKAQVEVPGDYIVLDETSHSLVVQSGLIAAQANANSLPIKGERGIFKLEQIEEYITRPHLRNIPRTRIVSIEQTTNFGGGAIWPIEYIQDIAKLCKANNVYMHLDGARLFNACAHTNIKPKEYVKLFDSAFVDFSKGLGAPMGAVLVGSKEFIEKAWYYKFQIGGGMHQAGIIAAGCLYGLKNNIYLLQEDHDKAKYLSNALDKIAKIDIDKSLYETNIIYFGLKDTKLPLDNFIDVLLRYGIRMLRIKDKIRAITHRDISYDQINFTIKVINETLKLE
ncbi:threonine aldolase [Candidatus Phycorickettsia trachydisci]|uniref:Threonine aldolase n=1 Tax=Candidatus Phycorickettsia trachydisci TaxID=2115978 RepID=A0A2P1P9H5_9RICK|nr:GntG family PLP-dependent aldolase [Candidatus Phycorickettsia trachydisci]AVP87921.1 threonine aldolase [Candidatus Phycorickettsia trachydisci]